MAKASVYFTLDGAGNPHDVKAIKQGLDALPGVLSVSVRAGSGCVAVDFDTTGVQAGRIRKQLEKMGYPVTDSKTDPQMM